MSKTITDNGLKNTLVGAGLELSKTKKVKGRFLLPEAAHDVPVMTIFAGPNGAGKSTLRELWSQERPLDHSIDSDTLAKDLHLTDVAAG